MVIGLVGGGASASAAAPFPHVTDKAVIFGLPTFQQLPGKVEVETVLTRSLTRPCLPRDTLHEVVVPLPGSVVHPMRVAARPGRSVYTRPLAWDVETLAFATPHAAKAWLAKLVAVERRCPTTAAVTDIWHGVHTMQSRQVSFATFSAKGWTGYRGVAALTERALKTNQRQIWTVLARGNALVFISVTVDAKALSAVHQETWRQGLQDRINANLIRLST